MRFLAPIISLCLLFSRPLCAQNVPPLPAAERITAVPPLTLTLRISASRVAIGEVPTFTVVIRNVGSAPVLLNPGAVANIRIFTASGAPVPPASGGIADYWVRTLKPADFVPLEPGRTHEFAVSPAYHALEDHSLISQYVDRRDGSERRLALPAGDYGVRLTYVAFPDYGASGYDVNEVPNAWEGLIEAPSVPLTVLPPSDTDVQNAIAKIESDERPLASIELVRLGRVTRAIDPLLRLFVRAPDLRQTIAESVLAIDAGRGAPAIVAATAALPARERQAMVTTRAFAEAARAAPDCAAVPLIVDATEDVRGDVFEAFGDSLRGISARCPGLRSGFITLLRTPAPAPKPSQGGELAYARGHAARALGRIGNPDDVPLLVAVLRKEIPGLPAPSGVYGDPAREGAARALGQLGGAEAAAALSAQLNDRTGNRFIMPVIVQELGRLNAPGAEAALTRLLDSSDQSLLVRVVMTLQQLHATAAVPQLLALLSHPNATVRNYASRGLLELGAAVKPSDIRPALDDRDDNVRANALFFLARYGDATALPLFVQRIASPVQFEREASVQGITRFGTADTFAPLRAALETAPPSSASYVSLALSQLTFAPIQRSTSLTEWDAWWKTHAGKTRLQWAEEAIDVSATNRAEAGVALEAARYLTVVQPSPRTLIERTLTHRSWAVRDAAIAAVEHDDRTRAAALLLRELDSRYLGACDNAVRRLGALTADTQTVNCMQPADRQRAKAHWASRVTRGIP